MKKMIVVLLLLLSGSGIFAQPGGTFEGLLIYYNEEVIEVKRGDREMTFQYDQSSMASAAESIEMPSKVELCQWVRVDYTTEQGVHRVTKLIILKAGYCN
jgi:hypothetical protein